MVTKREFQVKVILNSGREHLQTFNKIEEAISYAIMSKNHYDKVKITDVYTRIVEREDLI